MQDKVDHISLTVEVFFDCLILTNFMMDVVLPCAVSVVVSVSQVYEQWLPLLPRRRPQILINFNCLSKHKPVQQELIQLPEVLLIRQSHIISVCCVQASYLIINQLIYILGLLQNLVKADECVVFCDQFEVSIVIFVVFWPLVDAKFGLFDSEHGLQGIFAEQVVEAELVLAHSHYVFHAGCGDKVWEHLGNSLPLKLDLEKVT